MELASIYHKLILISPKVEVAIRCLYWNNVKILKYFRNTSSKRDHVDKAKTIKFAKIVAFLIDNGV